MSTHLLRTDLGTNRDVPCALQAGWF